jgi:hypothetical protein
MDDWLSYSLHDLLIFSPEAYARLFELANESLWPLHLPLALLAVVVLYGAITKREWFPKMAYTWLALSWLFVGLWFLRGYYSQINPFAEPLSFLFIIETVLLAWAALSIKKQPAIPDQVNYLSIIGWLLISYGYFIHPLLLLLLGRHLYSLEMISITPDPTVIATLGFLMLVRQKGFIFLMIIPSVWILLSILTYMAF